MDKPLKSHWNVAFSEIYEKNSQDDLYFCAGSKLSAGRAQATRHGKNEQFDWFKKVEACAAWRNLILSKGYFQISFFDFCKVGNTALVSCACWFDDSSKSISEISFQIEKNSFCYQIIYANAVKETKVKIEPSCFMKIFELLF